MGRTVTTNSRLVIRINGREVEGTLRDVGNEIRKLKKDLARLNASDPEFAKKKKELDELKKHYAAIRTEINGSAKSIGGLKSVLGGVAAVMGVAFAVDTLIQWGQLIFQNAEKVRALKKELSTITGLDGSQLKSATINVGALADTFDINSSEIAKATNVLSKRMKVPFEEAFAEIKKGFEEGLNYSGDFLEQVREYSPFIKEAGGSIQDMMDIIRSGTVDGVFNDKAIDAVKEGLLSIREMTPATQAALVGLGIDIEEMTRKIESGQMSYWEALQMVSKEMNNTTANSRVMGQVLADVWKGAGEDAGVDYLKSIYKIGNETKNLTQTQKAAIVETQKSFEANQKLNAAYESLTGTTSQLNMFWISTKNALGDLLLMMTDYQGLKLSDDIIDENTQLKALERELLNTNTSQQRRNEILKDLERMYPNIWEGLDKEKAGNEELSEAIDRVSEALKRKYQLQLEQEKVDEAAKKSAKADNEYFELEQKLQNKITELQFKYNVKIPVDLENESMVEKVAWLNKELEGKTKSFSFDLTSVNGLVHQLNNANLISQNFANNLRDVEETAGRVSAKIKGITVEQQQVNRALLKAFEGVTFPTLDNKGAKDPNALAKQQEAAKEAKRRADQAKKEAQREAKQKADQVKRDAEAEVKRREQLLKELENLEKNYRKNLHDSTANFNQEDIDLMVEGFEKELAQINFEIDQKQLALSEEINGLEQLQKDYRQRAADEDKKHNSEAANRFRQLADDQANIISYKESSLLSIQKTGENKRLKLVAEYQLKEAELRAKANDSLFTKLETTQNNEMAKMTSMSEAMRILRQYYSDEELKSVKTLQDAREKLATTHSKEMLSAQSKALQQEINNIVATLNHDAFNEKNGLSRILTDEAKEKLIANLEQAENAISRVNNALSGEVSKDNEEQAAKDEEAKTTMLSGIDLLGFSADQWTTAFENLDTAGSQMEKLAAAINIVEMALQTAMNAWGMLADAQNKALDKSLKKYEKNAENKKKTLQNQLDNGYISQAEYNAKIEALETDLEAKRSEIEYKKAMTDWKMNLAQIQIQTALGVMKAVAASPQSGGLPWSAIVGGIGLLQTGIAMKNKPKKEGYFDGGLTKGSGEVDAYGRELADGPAHAGEYYVAKRWLSVPDVANAVNYIDDRVNGRASTSTTTNNEPISVANPDSSISPILLARIADVLQKVDETITDFKENPPEVTMSKNWENTKRIKESLDRVESINKKILK
ncbi:phage tail tape measure protein [Empedobacter tilapiae]